MGPQFLTLTVPAAGAGQREGQGDGAGWNELSIAPEVLGWFFRQLNTSKFKWAEFEGYEFPEVLQDLLGLIDLYYENSQVAKSVASDWQNLKVMTADLIRAYHEWYFRKVEDSASDSTAISEKQEWHSDS